jgi:hypothetical protein
MIRSIVFTVRARAAPGRIAGAKQFIHDFANGGGTTAALGAAARLRPKWSRKLGDEKLSTLRLALCEIVIP